MRYAVLGAATAAALFGAATIAGAQMQDDKGKGQPDKGPAATQSEKGDQSAPKAGTETGKGQKSAQPQTTDQPKSTDGQRKAAGERATDRPKASEAPKADKSPSKTTEQQRAGDRQKTTENPQPGKDQKKADQDRTQDRQKTTETPKRDMDRQKTTDTQRGDKDRQKTTRGRDDQGRDGSKAAEGRKDGERVRVTEQQRTTVRERLIQTRVEKTRINVSLNIGTTVPRSVRLRPLPATIIQIAPEYRGYSYVVLEDETIVIINPRTYVIVDYIPAGTQRADRGGRAHLVLSSDQMRFVAQHVPKDRTVEVRARLALGAEVPRDVELLVFPNEVTARIPELDGYRYVVSGGDVIIVNPRDYEVVLVIE